MLSKNTVSVLFYYRIVFLLFAGFFFSSCEDEDEFLSVSDNKIGFLAEGDTYSLEITSNTSWTVSVADSWVKTSASAGKGDAELTLTASSNTTQENRTTVLTVSAGSEVCEVEIIQHASYLTLSARELVFDAEGTPMQVSVSSNYKWVLIKPESAWWCEVDILEGEGDGRVTFTPVPYTERVRRGTDNIVFSCFHTSTELAIRQEIKNEAPVSGDLLTPYHHESEVPIPVSFSWESAVDPDGDEVCYTLYISGDGNAWTEVVSRTTETSCRVTTEYLDEYSTYYWKVVSQDEFGGETASEVFRFTTGVSCIYEDGEVMLHQRFTSDTEVPVHLVVLGDGFILEDYEYGGAFDQAAETAIEAFFSVEPYPTYRDHFTVYKVAAYSPERGATITSDFYDLSHRKQTRNTVFETILEGGSSTGIVCNSDKVFDYVGKIPAIPARELVRTTVILIINLEVYAGTTLMWIDGGSIAMCPMGDTFEEIVYHEAGGHAFGRLLDEYIYNASQTLPAKQVSDITTFRNGNVWDFGANLSLTSAPADIHWNHYFGRQGYDAVGVYEGGYFYGRGIWRPEYNSCMNDNVPYFNAASREAIVRRIMNISGKEFDYTAYYQRDHIRSYAGTLRQVITRSTFRMPLAPPVLKEK
ncbi:MAG: M64 family metallo-endopeptidase [Bacteroides sp.]|nr:M64 family metallo-endopeptidase [Bacteroides sp.]